jgi:chromosome segregation ATPase
VSNTIEEEIDKNGKASTNDKVELLRGVKQTPMQKVLTESNPRGTDKFEVSRETLEFDKQFFQRQLNRIAKSYQAEIRTQQMKARDKAIEYVERNMFLAKETLQKELTHLQAQFQESKQEIEGMRRHAKFYEGALANQESIIAQLKSFIFNQAGNGDPQYLDEDDPEKPSKLNQRVLTLRKFETAQHDPILKAPFSLFNAHVKLNLDQKLDLVERQAIL